MTFGGGVPLANVQRPLPTTSSRTSATESHEVRELRELNYKVVRNSLLKVTVIQFLDAQFPQSPLR